VKRSAPIMHRIRSRKTKEEVAQIQRAMAITGKAFERVCGFVKPGVKEYEIEAEITHEFLRNGSRGHAYTPIIASGYNACVLHYITNDQVCNDGDVILMDFGCEYGGYASDLTRCVPVNGRFTKRQREVYNAVLRVKNEATQAAAPRHHARRLPQGGGQDHGERIDRPGPHGQERCERSRIPKSRSTRSTSCTAPATSWASMYTMWACGTR
jgi:Xaa-Pro aminopeptidase